MVVLEFAEIDYIPPGVTSLNTANLSVGKSLSDSAPGLSACDLPAHSPYQTSELYPS